MFEFLNGIYIKKNNKSYVIISYDENSKKFILEENDGEEKETINLSELFNSKANLDIDEYNNWKSLLFNGLIKYEGKITIDILSTETDDNWFVDIYRYKTLLPIHEFNDPIILINYAIVCNGEIVGDIYTRRGKFYNGCLVDEEKDFSKWIEEQIGNDQFNNKGYCNSFSSIITSKCLSSEKENDLLLDAFYNK